MGQLDQLRYLQLNNNELQGVLPDELGGLSSLIAAEFSNNGFEGDMPDSICENRKQNGGTIELLIADCAGKTPAVICDCCSSCR